MNISIRYIGTRLSSHADFPRFLNTLLILGLLLLLPLSVSADLPDEIVRLKATDIYTNYGRRIVPLGDQNNDGFDDIAVAEDFKISVYLGGSSPDTIPVLIIDSVNGWFTNIGDVSGDGFDDLVIPGRSPFGWKNGLYFGGPLLDATRDAWFGLDTLYAHGYCARGHDINADGIDEIFCTKLQDEVLMFDLGPSPDSIPDLQLRPVDPGYYRYNSFGVNLISGDFNGDDTTDLAVYLQHRSQDSAKGGVYLYWGGVDFDTLPDLILHEQGPIYLGVQYYGEILEKIGDFDGDGYEDLMVGPGVVDMDTINNIYFGGPDIDSFPDISFEPLMEVARSAGDINHDGYPDIITSYPTDIGGRGWVNIYFGGPDADAIPDVHIDADDLPFSKSYFGLDVSGVGDFDGDGIDDFAISMRVNAVGTVIIYAGWDQGTGVEYDYEPTLPKTVCLSQNYPNPFNAGTEISFDLPERATVTMTITNILGQQVVTLIDKELPAGTHRLSWNGDDAQGRAIGSGVYFCTLRTSQETQTIKMIMLK